MQPCNRRESSLVTSLSIFSFSLSLGSSLHFGSDHRLSTIASQSSHEVERDEPKVRRVELSGRRLRESRWTRIPGRYAPFHRLTGSVFVPFVGSYPFHLSIFWSFTIINSEDERFMIFYYFLILIFFTSIFILLLLRIFVIFLYLYLPNQDLFYYAFGNLFIFLFFFISGVSFISNNIYFSFSRFKL